jgi:hypothetical protein
MSTEIILIKTPSGALIPADPQAGEFIAKLKMGAGIRAKVVRQRNVLFHRKMFALFNLAYEHFCEFGLSEMTYKGQKVVPEFDRFRKDLIILAGHYTPVFNIRGELRLEAKSIGFANCSEDEAERIYSDCINAALKNVYKAAKTEAELRNLVDQILEFA